MTHEGRACYHFSHLEHHRNSIRDLIDQIASGIKEVVIIKQNTWTIMESFDFIAHDSLFHHDEHYGKKCGPLIVVHNASSEISI